MSRVYGLFSEKLTQPAFRGQPSQIPRSLFRRGLFAGIQQRARVASTIGSEVSASPRSEDSKYCLKNSAVINAIARDQGCAT
jgi:hypothetical protein